MKALLTAIRSRLQASASIAYVRDADIFVTEDERLIPQSLKFPAIGLKDGTVKRIELIGNMWEVHLGVRIIIYVQLTKPEAAIMGDISNKGVLDISQDILALLDQNSLDIAGMISAHSDTDEESVLFADETTAIQKKTVIFEYIREEARP